MSQWVHIRGAIEFSSPVYEYKKPKPANRKEENREKWFEYYQSAYFVDPKEQLKLGAPEAYYDSSSERAKVRFQVFEYSLPRAKKYIEEAFKLLPQGESLCSYWVNQDNTRSYSSCNSFDFKCEEKQFLKAITALYNQSEIIPLSEDQVKKYSGIENGWIEHVNNFVVTIRDDIRYADGIEMLHCLEKFFSYLDSKDIETHAGCLEWEDDYRPDFLFGWRCVGIDNYFYVRKISTDTILYSKRYEYDYNDECEKVCTIKETGSLSSLNSSCTE